MVFHPLKDKNLHLVLHNEDLLEGYMDAIGNWHDLVCEVNLENRHHSNFTVEENTHQMDGIITQFESMDLKGVHDVAKNLRINTNTALEIRESIDVEASSSFLSSLLTAHRMLVMLTRNRPNIHENSAYSSDA